MQHPNELATITGSYSDAMLAHESLADDAERPLTKVRVSIVSNNRMFRSCLKASLEALRKDYQVAAYADPEEWRAAREIHLNEVLLLSVFGGAATQMAIENFLPDLCATDVTAKTIILSDQISPSVIAQALRRGAKGFISADSDPEMTICAIRLVLVGGTFIPSDCLLALAKFQSAVPCGDEAVRLTNRQTDVLKLATFGYPNKIIAYKLDISETTAKVHISNLLRKFKVKNRTELAYKYNNIETQETRN